MAAGVAEYLVRVKWTAVQSGPADIRDNAFDVEVWEDLASDEVIVSQDDVNDNESWMTVTLKVGTTPYADALDVGRHFIYAKVQRQELVDAEPDPNNSNNKCTVDIVGVEKVVSLTTTSYTNSPGAAETRFVGKGDSGSSTAVVAYPDPSVASFPTGYPTWTNATAVPFLPFLATFPIDTASGSSSGTTVRATCGTDAKALKIVVI